MRHAPASHLRGRYAMPVQSVPREGTALRALYDLFQANKGWPISLPHYNPRCIVDLTDYYGLDIRCIYNARRYGGKSQWVLAGEWFGRIYIDYLAEQIARAA